MYSTDNPAYRNKILGFHGLRGDGNDPENCGYIRPTIKRILPENTGDWAKMWFKIPRYVLKADDDVSHDFSRSVTCFGKTLKGNTVWLVILLAIMALLLSFKA